MAFLTPNELSTVAYSYQITEVTEGDDDIVMQAIDVAIFEVKGYLNTNNKKEYDDGRLRYDVASIFAATGNNRNTLILQYTKICALWHLLVLSNPDVIYDHVKERYDRAIDYLKKVNKGDVTLDLPLLEEPAPGEGSQRQPFRFGSRTKFNHE
jgi:hypothetical protein